MTEQQNLNLRWNFDWDLMEFNSWSNSVNGGLIRSELQYRGVIQSGGEIHSRSEFNMGGEIHFRVEFIPEWNSIVSESYPNVEFKTG